MATAPRRRRERVQELREQLDTTSTATTCSTTGDSDAEYDG